MKTNDTYYTTGAPGTDLFAPVNADIDAQTVTEYDGASRPIASIFKVGGTEENRTTYSYGGDRVHVDPPDGQTPTTTITDVRDHTVELREYKASAPRRPARRRTTSPPATPTPRRGSSSPSSTRRATPGATDTTSAVGRRQQPTRTPARPSPPTTTCDRPTSVTDSRKNKVTTTYDALGRTTGTWQGDADTGTRLSVTKYDTVAKGELYGEYTYRNSTVYSSVLHPVLDEMYRPTLTRYTVSKTAEPELGGTYEFGTQYGLDGTVTAQSYPAAGGLAGESVSYQYDGLQRPVGMNTSLNTTGSYVTDAQYSPTSQLEGVELWSGKSTDTRTWLDFRYERGTERLLRQSVRVENAASPALDTTYGYDDAGNVRSIADRPAGGPTDAQCLTYDTLGRLTEAWTSAATPDGASGTGVQDRACTAAPASSNVGGVSPYWNSYSYDVTGNRTGLTRHGVGITPTSTVTSTYGQGEQGPHQLSKTVTQTAATDTTPAVTSQDTYTYDAAGNTETRVLGGDTQTLVWDKQNHLTQVKEADGSSTNYVYDAAGDRLLRETTTEKVLYLPGMELRLDKAGKTVGGSRYYSFGGQTIAQRTTDGVTYLAGDSQGTAQLAIASGDGSTQRRRLDSFGVTRRNNLASVSSWANDKGFVGGTNDETTGLVHLGAREYDADLGRFILDPVMNLANPRARTQRLHLRQQQPGDLRRPVRYVCVRRLPDPALLAVPEHDTGHGTRPARLSPNAAAAGYTLDQVLGRTPPAHQEEDRQIGPGLRPGQCGRRQTQSGGGEGTRPDRSRRTGHRRRPRTTRPPAPSVPAGRPRSPWSPVWSAGSSASWPSSTGRS
ncbi:hypothetical protein SFUMM280S_08952 [Streptomyces fumanus]